MGKSGVTNLSEDLFRGSDEEEKPKQVKLSRMMQWAGAKIDPKTGEIAKTTKPKKRTLAAAVFDRARAETQGMMTSGDWSACSARHIVALYDLMHLKCYGVEVSMSSTERHTATLRAGGFVKREFSGDYDKAIDFFRWVWTREMGREKWRRENGREGSRLTVGLCLSGALITDYRVMLSRSRR